MIKKIQAFFWYFVFVATTLAIAGVFYEGMALKWYQGVSILVMCMDFSFIISTVINLIPDRKSKWFYVDLFSLVAIVVAIFMKVMGIAYPIWSLVAWYFYLWFNYGIRLHQHIK